MLKSLAVSLLALASLPNAVLAARRHAKMPRQSGVYGSLNATNTSTVALDILTKTGVRNETAPLLYGWMFEDINHSGDGGLYGELLTNRAFEGSNIVWGTLDDIPYNSIVWQENPCEAYGPVLTGWAPYGNTYLRLDNLRPLSYSHRTVLAVDIPSSAANTTSPVGVQNLGWWGVPVTPQTYNVSFYIYPEQVRNQYNPSTALTVSLISNVTGEVWASTTLEPQEWNTVNWTYVTTQIVSNVTAPDSNNTFAISFDPVEAAGQTYFFSEVSLFGETFKDYPNGLRKDLADNIYDLNPKFLRWPGGNNLEGYSIQTRWKWWETIGPLKDRWPRPGNWEYYNTNGLGLLEFLQWTEGMEAENVLAIYTGYSLGDAEQSFGDQFPSTEEALYPLLQEALDEIEFIIGDTSTYWGAKRAELGHPEPFTLNYIELGNEDWFSTNYPFRFNYFYNALKEAYPDITLISTAYNEAPAYPIDLPPGSMWDTHHYEEPQFFIGSFDFWDNWQEATNNTNVTILIGEYSVFQVDTDPDVLDFTDPPDLHIFYPRLLSAIAEGVYLLGAERNPNVVKMTSYAPSLQNWNWFNWTPNLIAFDSDPRNTVLSASYWLQLLFNHFHGTESLTVENTKGDFGPLYWASSAEGDDTVYLKVINVGNTTVPLSVSLESEWSQVNGTIITNSDVNAYNYLGHPSDVVPKPLNLTSVKPDASGDWNWNVPAYSITVLQFNLD